MVRLSELDVRLCFTHYSLLVNLYRAVPCLKSQESAFCAVSFFSVVKSYLGYMGCSPVVEFSKTIFEA